MKYLISLFIIIYCLDLSLCEKKIYCKPNTKYIEAGSILIKANASTISCKDGIISAISPNAITLDEQYNGSNLGLNFENNSISILQANTFHKLRNVLVVDISFNRLRAIYAGTFLHMPDLYTLLLNNNQISYIEDDLSHLTKMIRLELMNNQLIYFTRNIFDGIFMHSVLKKNVDIILYVFISGNKFKCDCDIVWLRSVESYNKFFFKEANFCHDKPSINIIDLLTDSNMRSNSSINTVSETCTKDQLKGIPEQLPSDIFLCTGYETDLISESIYLTENTKVVSCANGKIISISETAFISKNPKIDNNLKLNFKNNSIYELKSDTFDRLRNLREVDLSYNKIQNIKAGTFKYGQKLEYIRLQHNQMTNIEGNWSNLKKLRLLNVEHNRLLHFKMSIFEVIIQNSLWNNVSLLTKGNKFECCELQWLNGLKLTIENLTMANNDTFCSSKKTMVEIMTFDKLKINEIFESKNQTCTKEPDGIFYCKLGSKRCNILMISAFIVLIAIFYLVVGYRIISNNNKKLTLVKSKSNEINTIRSSVKSFENIGSIYD